MPPATKRRRSICADTLFSRKRKRYCWHGRTLGRRNKPLPRQELFRKRLFRKPNRVGSRRLMQVRIRLSRAPGKDASTGQWVIPRLPRKDCGIPPWLGREKPLPFRERSRHRSNMQATAFQAFFPMRLAISSSMMSVMASSPYWGLHPHSLLAAVSSSASGQLSAMPCKSGFTL